MEKRNTYDYPIEVTLDVVCGKWKGIILCQLLHQTLRYGELKKKIPKISQKMLTSQLKELEKDNLVKRTVYKQVPPKVEYSLTTYGKELEWLLNKMSQWGKEHIELVKKIKKEDDLVSSSEIIE